MRAGCPGGIVMPSSDPIIAPSHYTQGGIECIDAIRAALGRDGFVAFCRGMAMKYIWRAPHKGTFQEDIQKAERYIAWADQELGRKDEEGEKAIREDMKRACVTQALLEARRCGAGKGDLP
jgi:hypothetical protein